MLTPALLGVLEDRIRSSGAPIDELLSPGLSAAELQPGPVLEGQHRANIELEVLWQWRNGGCGPMRPARGAIGHWMWLLSVEEALEQERFWRELEDDEPEHRQWWREGWLPFAKSNNDALMADVRAGTDAPAPVWSINPWDMTPPKQPLHDSIEEFVRFCLGMHDGGAWYWDADDEMFRGRRECLSDQQREVLGIPIWSDP